MAGVRDFELDDVGMTLLANALLLGYSFALVQRRGRSGDPDSRRIDRIEYSERRELREVLLLAGALDHRLDAGGESGEAMEPLGEWDRRIKKLSHSQDDIAQLRTLDITFPEAIKTQFGILSNVDDIDPFELRCSFANLGPTPHTRTILKLVLEYFCSSKARDLVKSSHQGEALVARETGIRVPGPADPISLEAKRAALGTDTLIGCEDEPCNVVPNQGFTETDKPYVEEGVRMIRDGRARSAMEAARILVEKHGAVVVSEWTPASNAIRTLSIAHTASRLQKKISKAFRSRN